MRHTELKETNQMKIVAHVPVKMNNERLPGKNVKAFENGRPLIHYMLNTLKQVKRIDEVYVYCSDERVIEYLPHGVLYLKRDADLDSQVCDPTEISRRFCKAVDADIYIRAFVTSPFVSPASIDRAIDAMLDGGHDSAFSVTENRIFKWEDGKPNYDISRPPRTQDMKPFYIESTGFYGFKKAVIEKTWRYIGENPALIPVSAIEAIDVDDSVDFAIANAVFNARLAVCTPPPPGITKL
jgi:CMP-N-acetylneuraminic acid synthetase